MPFTNINGVQVAYDDAGTGPPIIFIPSLAGNKNCFNYQFIGLRDSYRVISFDIPCTRKTSSYVLEALADDVVMLMNVLKLESAFIAGHSFGAMIAQWMASTHRDRVEALILISAFPHLPEIDINHLLQWMAPGQIRAESNLQSVLRRLFGVKPPAPVDDPDDVESLIAQSTPLSRSALNARLEMIRMFDSRPWLAEIEAPTLIIAGASDREYFLAGAQTLYQNIPDSELEIVEDSGHFCFYTRHDIVNSTIDDFLRRHPAS